MENLFLVSISINTDIFEANLINIILLLVLLFNVLGAALKTEMFERKSKILSEVQGAEQRLTEAAERLSEAKTQSEQAALIITQIAEKTGRLRHNILINNWNRAYEEMHRMEKAATLAVKYETQKAARENQDSLLTAGLTNAYTFIINDLTYEDCCALNTKRILQIPKLS
jgi:F0F1-type ATP synthase membrane subunit b/b'